MNINLSLSVVGLDANFKRVAAGRELRTSFGEKLQIPLGSICQNCLDGVHIFWNAGTGSIKKFKSSVSTCL